MHACACRPWPARGVSITWASASWRRRRKGASAHRGSRREATISRWSLRLPRRPVYCLDGARDVLAKWLDPAGRTAAGRWQLWKEAGAHGVGRWTVAVLGSPAARDGTQ